MVKFLNMSEPKCRVLLTRRAKPTLASHAAIGSIKSKKNRLFIEEKRRTITSERAKTSSARSAIKNCFRCSRRVIKGHAGNKEISRMIEKNISCSAVQSLVYKTSIIYYTTTACF